MLRWIVDFILSEETEKPSVMVGAILTIQVGEGCLSLLGICMRASVPLKHVEKKMWMNATEWSLEACSREELSGRKRSRVPDLAGSG